ncbi:SusC/RagA family TonB-linked outer membrane protein [Flavilitoribacter nigricans]|uniref:SusC/RagA family protein n=1 Tax=Flavilitoribacter nigricans (strain ATCC 23147 / DSM 23189 / NBRC 102662 / NCIMB 1420 / SS-2) TaxID=1122177 RepID=A0A2D0NBX9_FLAN2|nr:TonB-dependent receptor [Flavilitoribacter nigricans]PHN05283.1 SusC/RagA family protein [Flavilitoribacter nigricans DSM 23189 = NBRC 102662]
MEKTRLCKTLLLTTWLCLLFAGSTVAQVSGVVTDKETGEPLIGASVLVKGTSKGTITSFDGTYTLDATSDEVLLFSYTGYSALEEPVSGRTTVDVSLDPGQLLDEIVVTGYTAQSKRDITGAVTTVDSEELLAVPATTFSQQLQGRASGVSIVNDATPGGEATVRIRGFGTIGNNNPLYIIDGVPSTNQSTLNPNDIETLQVLKDASAASIYGSRAANGVIIITTKQGKLGRPKISYSTYYGLQSATNDVESLNARELGEYLYLADLYAGKTPAHGQYTFGSDGSVTIPRYVFPSGANSVDESLYSLTPDNIYAITESADTYWWGEVTQDNAPIVNHQLSASGATESARYALSLNYFSQEAITRFVSYDRVSLRANTEFTVANRLKVGENFTFALGNRKGGFGNNQEQNAVSGSYKHHPLLPIYDIAGNFAGSRGANLGNNFNPYASLFRDQDDRTWNLRGFGNVYADLEIIDNLSVRSSFGIDLNTSRRRDIGRPQPEYVEGNFINSSSATNNYSYQWVWSNTLNYSHTFNDVHQLNANIGVEAIEQFGEFFSAGRQRFAFQTTDVISYLDLGDASTSSNGGNVFTDYALFSQFGQFNYSYNDRYLAQFTVRNDASSRFRQASNSAIFPAFSLGWRLTEEPFFQNAFPFISDFKLRYGWGQTGNQDIGDYNAYTTYLSNIYAAGYPITGAGSNIGFSDASFGNPNAKWETTTSNNLGFDARMFNDKLELELDLWNRITTDMLLQVPITFTAGDGSSPAINVGQVTNRGLDLALTYSDNLGDFRYSVTGNFSTYRNNIDALNTEESRIFGYSSRVPSMTVTQVGYPISSFYGFNVLGIFQSQAEVETWPEYGDYNAPGKFRIEDVNGDGQINDEDRTVIGNPHPDYTYGLNLNIGYKNFELTLFGNGSQGNDVFNYVRFFADFNSFQGNRSRRALYEAWQPSNPSAPRSQWVAANPNATTPIMDANDQISSRVSTYLLEDGSYFRLKNVQLTYNLPATLAQRWGLGGGQIYVQGQNMLTITNYSGLNPEIQTGADTTLGFDGGYMPVSRTIIFGLNVSLQ